MTNIDIIKQLKGDIQRTCNAYKTDAASSDAELAIDAIAEEANRTAQAAIASLKQTKEVKQ